MKLSIRTSLLVSMLLVGIICGLAFYFIIIPSYGSSIIHCIMMGILFGFINYLISYQIYKKYDALKKSNELLKNDLKIDNLTGLFNRSTFDKDVMDISSTGIFSMIFIDIDNFREFNNQFGHQTGDIVLKKVSQLIKNSVRLNDRVYRYGGEELVVFLKDCTKKNALEIAEKIRVNINLLDNSPYPQITVSLGVSTYPEDGHQILEIVKACDDALLEAKKMGKNRTFVYKGLTDKKQ